MTMVRSALATAGSSLRLRDVPVYLSAAFLLLLVLLSVFAPFVAPYSPTDQDMKAVLVPASAEHLLGTDDLGRDVLSRLIHGAPLTLMGSFIAVGVACLIGVPVGLVAGFTGGWVDAVISRAIDTMLSFPAIVLAIAVTGVLGVGLVNSMIAIGIVFSPTIARLMRGQTLIGRNALYVAAARCFGAAQFRLLAVHVLPNAIQPVIVQVTLLLPTALLAEASLSFLGLGVQPPQPSWGAMLSRSFFYAGIAPSQMYAPGLAILVTALSFNTLGEYIRVRLDPTMKSR
jgi:peptide/nickel transport system permease protein